MATSVLLPLAALSNSDWSIGSIADIQVDSSAASWERIDNTFGNYAEATVDALSIKWSPSPPFTVSAYWRGGYDVSPVGKSLTAGVALSSVGTPGSRTLTALTDRTAAPITTTSTNSSIARPGGGTWALADIQLLIFAWAADKPEGDGCTAHICYGQLTVTYSLQSGAFGFLAASLVGAAVGLAEMAGLSRAIYAKERILLSTDECVTMYRELREAKNTVYCY